MVTIDESFELLHRAGWSVGDTAFYDQGKLVWQVYAHRGERKILVRAPSQREAWQRAVDQASRLEVSAQ